MSDGEDHMYRLSIVTVVRNDLIGLKETIESVKNICNEGIEHWVIDGASDDGAVEYLKSNDYFWLSWISESDSGIYEAMNKGLNLVSGDYVLFLNAGDVLHPHFSWTRFCEYLCDDFSGVLFGRTIECYKEDYYLRPGNGREHLILKVPAHQATFYPRRFYSKERYPLDRPVSGDAKYTSRAVKEVGYCFVPQVVSLFQLGGVSSSYGSLTVFYKRWHESSRFRNRVRLLGKTALWICLPPGWVYRLLSLGKYTKLKDISQI